MTMTRPDFEALAHMCADETHKELLCDATIDLLASFCKSRNPNFDSDRFHNRVASLKATYQVRNRLAKKGFDKEWLESHIEVIV